MVFTGPLIIWLLLEIGSFCGRVGDCDEVEVYPPVEEKGRIPLLFQLQATSKEQAKMGLRSLFNTLTLAAMVATAIASPVDIQGGGGLHALQRPLRNYQRIWHGRPLTWISGCQHVLLWPIQDSVEAHHHCNALHTACKSCERVAERHHAANGPH